MQAPLERFYHPPKRYHTHQHSFPIPLSPHNLVATNVFSISMDLLTLGVSYKQNHVICGPVGLVSFSAHVFEVRVCCSMCQYIILFFFLCLPVFERERQSASRGGAEREGDTESEAGSRL